MCVTTEARKSVLGERTFGKMRRQQEDNVLYAHCIHYTPFHYKYDTIEANNKPITTPEKEGHDCIMFHLLLRHTSNKISLCVIGCSS